jgi:hypothetical protein
MKGPDIDPEKLRAALAELDKGKAKSQAHKVPTVYKYRVNLDWFRAFTWKERIKILFGYSLFVVIRVRTKHNAGEIDPVIAGSVVEHNNPDEFLRQGIEKDIRALEEVGL